MKSQFSPLSKLAVKPGQALLFPVFNKHGILLAEKGTQLTEEQVEKIINLGEIYTYNRALLTALVEKEEASESNAIMKLAPPFKRLENLEEILHEIYEKPKNRINQSKILTIVTRIINICEKSPDASVAKIITDDNSNYTVKHAIHTAILCELSGRYLNWELEKRRNIISAALTMNISLGFLQDKLVNQRKPLSIIQKKLINEHPENSVELLKEMGISSHTWLDIVAKHHEAADGSGYPLGLKKDNIPIEAALVSLSDVYCAKVTGRNYREPVFANVAVRDIYLDKEQNIEGSLIEAFVKLLGIFPPGCIVKLKNGEVGIVTKRGSKVDTPKVLILNNAKNGPLALKILRDTANSNYAIKSVVASSNKFPDIDYYKVWPH